MIAIKDQREEVEREIRQRERLYPKWIETGRIREATATEKIATLKAAADSLRFIERHASGLRGLCHFLLASGDTPVPSADEAAALRAHPGVSALLEAWPEAEMRIFGLPPPAPPTDSDLFPVDPEREDA